MMMMMIVIIANIRMTIIMQTKGIMITLMIITVIIKFIKKVIMIQTIVFKIARFTLYLVFNGNKVSIHGIKLTALMFGSLILI